MTEHESSLYQLAHADDVDWKAEYAALYERCAELERMTRQLRNQLAMPMDRAMQIARELSAELHESIRVSQEVWDWNFRNQNDPYKTSLTAVIYGSTSEFIGKADTLEGAYAAAKEKLEQIKITRAIRETPATGVTVDAT